MKRILSLVAIVLMLFPTYAFAHSGGTDANGGHHDYNNVSGLGDYHYHHGYGAHLHENGICPYETNTSSTTSYNDNSSIAVYSSDDEYKFTEDELHSYILDEVYDSPHDYGVVSMDEYQELKEDYELLKSNSISVEESFEDTLTGVVITAIAGALACYLVYRKYR